MYPRKQPLLDELSAAKAAEAEIPNEPRFSHRRLKARVRTLNAECALWKFCYEEVLDRS